MEAELLLGTQLGWITEYEDVRIEERDLLLFGFLLEMKVATRTSMKAYLDSVMDSIQGERGFYNRVLKLQKSGFLVSKPIPHTNQLYYKLGSEGYKSLKYSRDHRSLPRFKSRYQSQNLRHDLTLTFLRTQFLISGECQTWVSENRIRAQFPFTKNWEKKHLPDAIYIDRDDQAVALEFEIARKSTPRYKEKIDNYVNTISSRFDEDLKISKVHFICLDSQVRDRLTDLTLGMSDLFEVEGLNVYTQ